jgi:hypothetical protein
LLAFQRAVYPSPYTRGSVLVLAQRKQQTGAQAVANRGGDFASSPMRILPEVCVAKEGQFLAAAPAGRLASGAKACGSAVTW